MATTTPPAITALPAAPDPNNRTTFNTLAYPWSAALPTFRTELSAVAVNVKANADEAVTSADTATTQAGLATTNGAAQVTLATTQATIATDKAALTALDRTQTGLDRTAAADSASAAAASAATASSAVAFVDTSPVVKGSADATKQIRFEVDGLTTATTRVLTVPNEDLTLAGRGANTFTAAQEMATGANIASAATVNLDTATGNRVHITGTTTITAVTLTRGPRTVIFDDALTLTHHATNNNLPGAANITTVAGDRAIYESDGTTVYCVAYTRKDGTGVVAAGAGNHMVTVHTANGQGSTNTLTRRYTTTMVNVGTAITYADSATLGASFTVADTGLYEVYRQDYHNVDAQLGFSVNSTQMTAAIQSIAVADVGAIGGARGGIISCISRSMRLSAGDVIRPHDQVSVNGTGDVVMFSVRKVGT